MPGPKVKLENLRGGKVGVGYSGKPLAIYKRRTNFLPDYVFLIFLSFLNRTRLISVMGCTQFGLNFFN